MRKTIAIAALFSFLVLYCSTTMSWSTVKADTLFIEAENFTPSSDGWQVIENIKLVRQASGNRTLWGATGDTEAIAEKTINIKTPGKHRIWVRRMYFQARENNARQGPFRLGVWSQGKELAGEVFDFEDHGRKHKYVWDHLDADLPAGELTLRLSKHENKNCFGLTRHIDCVLITDDLEAKPDHLKYAPRTYLRVTMGDSFEQPALIFIFAGHYYAPYYTHNTISRAGLGKGRNVARESLMEPGEQSPWIDIGSILYPDSGARLMMSGQYGISNGDKQIVPRLKAKFEFATAPDESAIVKTYDVDRQPGELTILVPPDLTTQENLSRLLSDKEIAENTGRIADSFKWPTIGKKPTEFPFFVRTSINYTSDDVVSREWKTLDYYGFTHNHQHRVKCTLFGPRYMENYSYCLPIEEASRTKAKRVLEAFKESGKSFDDIRWIEMMDEPTGQKASFMVECEGYLREFPAWLKELGKTPADLNVASWADVKPVLPEQRDEFPELHYYTQIFRTVAMTRYMGLQRKIFLDVWGRDFPTTVNLSGGAIFAGNFYAQGVDYFEFMDNDMQNAIGGEDWANLSATYQKGAYNVDLMRAATQRRGQKLMHILIAYAGRTAFDLKLKAASETARGVKTWDNFYYGPSYGGHEGGVHWRASDWSSKPETWYANAELIREIGGAEDLLIPAMPAKAEVAILYSSATDIWEYQRNNAFGLDRIQTWLALSHAQVPVDIVWEKDLPRGGLDGYKVCYLSGPNLLRDSADELVQWVKDGGTLWLTAGAAQRDEFNRPLDTLDAILPVQRKQTQVPQPFQSPDRLLYVLNPQDTATAGTTAMEVLSVIQQLTPKSGDEVLANYADGQPAVIKSKVGKGTVYSVGFLPGLSYIKPAVDARHKIQNLGNINKTPAVQPTPQQAEILERSYNVWEYPDAIREFLLTPVRDAKVNPPVTCDVPLVDAVLMTADKGSVLVLANYTLKPLDNIELTVRTPKPVKRVESVHHGVLKTERVGTNVLRFKLPLESSDYIKLYY